MSAAVSFFLMMAAADPLGGEDIPAPSEIVVTASRGPTPKVDEPIAISVLADSSGLFGLTDHVAQTVNAAAGTLVQAGSGQEHLTAIRSPVLTGGAGAGSFLYLQNGVPLRSAGFANVNGLFDAQAGFADRIEVIRGPGDVAYGSNAVHGVINVLSLAPADRAVDGVGGTLRLNAGAFDRYGVSGELFTSSLSVGGSIARDGGYRAISGGDQYKFHAAHSASDGDLTVTTRLSLHRLQQETAGFVRGERAYRDEALRRSNPNPDAFRNSDHGVLSSEIRLDGDVWDIAITPYALATDMRFLMHFLPSQAIENNQHAAIGVLAQATRSLGTRTEILVGLDAEKAEGSLREEQFIPDVFSYTQGLHYDYAVGSKSVAPWARVRTQLTERLSVQAGSRLTYTAYEYDNRTEEGTVGRFLRLADRSDEFAVVTGKVGATYQVTPALRGFATVSRGARPPQTTDLYRLQINQTEETPAPETLLMGEVGIGRIVGDRGIELAAFWGEKENFLFRDADGFTVNDGVTSHRGVEVEWRWPVGEKLHLSGSGAYAEHTYQFDRIVGRDSEVIRSGNRVDTAPKTLGQVTATYEIAPEVNVGGRFNHVGAYFTDAANTQRYPGHEVIDVFGQIDLTPRLRLDARINNLFDTRYATRADFAFGSERYFPGEERHLKLALTARY